MTEKYILYLNGKVYGIGNLSYMNELISDWIHCGMYGESSATFEIRKRGAVDGC